MSSPLLPVSIIIPAFNEEKSISDVLAQIDEVLKTTGQAFELIVVDDGSEDQTARKAKVAGAIVVRHEVNRGYGASLKTGVLEAQNDVIVITDADGTYPVDRIPDLLDQLKTADMVIGARIGKNVNIPTIRKPAKWLLKKLAEYITGAPIPDLNSGLRAFRRSTILQYFDILPEKFSFTTTLSVAMVSDGYKSVNMPIDYYKRSGKSKIVPWDFVEFVTLVVRLSMLFKPLKIFVPAALASFLLGSVKFLLDSIVSFHEFGGFTFQFFTNKLISSSTLILWLAGLQILLIGMVADGLVRKISQRMSQQGHSHSIVRLSHSDSNECTVSGITSKADSSTKKS